jgi:hypothetical protein
MCHKHSNLVIVVYMGEEACELQCLWEAKFMCGRKFSFMESRSSPSCAGELQNFVRHADENEPREL